MRVPLHDCCDLRADETLRNVAKRKLDSKILALASNSLVTSEAKYHKICYRDYTRPPTKTKSIVAESTKCHNEIIENEAFMKVCEYFLEIKEDPQILKLQDIVAKMEGIMTLSNEKMKVTSKKICGGN